MKRILSDGGLVEHVKKYRDLKLLIAMDKSPISLVPHLPGGERDRVRGRKGENLWNG